MVIAKGPDGQPLPVEVLSSLHGIKNENLIHPEYTIAIGESEVMARVPGPIALLQAKIANATDLSQEGRQDERHIHILVKLMPVYLVDLQTSIAKGRINEKEMLDLLEYLLTVIKSPKSRKVLKKLNIESRLMFSEIETGSSSKLYSFMTKRLPRILPGTKD